MHWRDDAIVLGTRRHGESSLVLEVLTRERGRCMGLVRGGRSPRHAAKLQPGNELDVTWRARLDEHLGNFQAEPSQVRASGLMETSLGLNVVQTLSAHVRLLPERDPHPELYEAMSTTLDMVLAPSVNIDDALRARVAAALVIRFELAVLDALGFGLDLSACALTGATEDLAFVSPKTGRAACRTAGQPWGDRLLKLPGFIHAPAPLDNLSSNELKSGFDLTGHFLNLHVWGPRGIKAPMTREILVNTISQIQDNPA